MTKIIITFCLLLCNNTILGFFFFNSNTIFINVESYRLGLHSSGGRIC